MEQLLSGLFIAAAGMTVVFIGLAVLMAVMMALTRAFRGPAPESVPPLAAPEPDAKALAAALGAAIVLAQGAPGPWPASRRHPSPWGAAGRQPAAGGQPWRGKGRP